MQTEQLMMETDHHFDPRETPEKGCHRNGYVRSDNCRLIDVQIWPMQADKPLDREGFCVLNKGDKVRASTEALNFMEETMLNEAAKRLTDRLDRKVKNGEDITEKDVMEHVRVQEKANQLVPVAIRRGWFYFKGYLPLKELFFE